MNKSLIAFEEQRERASDRYFIIPCSEGDTHFNDAPILLDSVPSHHHLRTFSVCSNRPCLFDLPLFIVFLSRQLSIKYVTSKATRRSSSSSISSRRVFLPKNTFCGECLFNFSNHHPLRLIDQPAAEKLPLREKSENQTKSKSQSLRCCLSQTHISFCHYTNSRSNRDVLLPRAIG